MLAYPSEALAMAYLTCFSKHTSLLYQEGEKLVDFVKSVGIFKRPNTDTETQGLYYKLLRICNLQKMVRLLIKLVFLYCKSLSMAWINTLAQLLCNLHITSP